MRKYDPGSLCRPGNPVCCSAAFTKRDVGVGVVFCWRQRVCSAPARLSTMHAWGAVSLTRPGTVVITSPPVILLHPLGGPPVQSQERGAVAPPARSGRTSAQLGHIVPAAPCEDSHHADASDDGTGIGAPAGRPSPPFPLGASERSPDTSLDTVPPHSPSDTPHDGPSASRAAPRTGSAEFGGTGSSGTAGARGAAAGASGALAAPLSSAPDVEPFRGSEVHD